MEFQISTADWSKAASALKHSDKDLYKALRKAVRDAAKPLLTDMRKAVKSIDSSASGGGGGGNARAAWALRGHAGTSSGVLLASGLAAKAAGRSGLRDTVARSTRVKIRDSGAQAGARIAVEGMPPDQRSLPAYLDQGSWRHPVMGNRHAWVTQTASPPGWFTKTAEQHLPKARQKVEAATKGALDAIARRAD